VPQFAGLYATLQAPVPWFTRGVLAVGLSVRHWGWLMLAGVSGVLLALDLMWRSPDVRKRADGWLLRRPGLGSVVRKLEAERYARTLGTLLGNGVSMLGALPLANAVVGNRVLRERLAALIPTVRAGEALSSGLARTEVLPSILVQMTHVGEESGTLPAMLLRAADTLVRDTDTLIERAIAALVPAVTVGLFLLIGAVIGSILVPLYDLTAAIG